MILEVAILNVIPNQEKDFEIAFAKATSIISSMAGYVSHQLQLYDPFPAVEHYELILENHK